MADLEKLVADLIYEADWEIRGLISNYDRDITDHFMIDEAEVVTAIIKAVKEADR